MKNLVTKRILAFALDYLLIAVYAAILFGVSTALYLENKIAINGQLLGFVSLTVPVFLYFFLMEKSKSRATLGKRVMKISVAVKQGNVTQSMLMRNLLKFLPWEIAHTGVHQVVSSSALEQEVSLSVWLALILPQIIIIGYLFSIAMSKGASSFYDKVAHTHIRLN
jgi:hypothetical protein